MYLSFVEETKNELLTEINELEELLENKRASVEKLDEIYEDINDIVEEKRYELAEAARDLSNEAAEYLVATRGLNNPYNETTEELSEVIFGQLELNGF
jgi:ElaB/YqjD/DUF883 family membrane-anchored ribosome-binding protein